VDRPRKSHRIRSSRRRMRGGTLWAAQYPHVPSNLPQFLPRSSAPLCLISVSVLGSETPRNSTNLSKDGSNLAAKAEQGNALTTLLADRWEQASRKIERLAEILPEDRIEHALVNGIRTWFPAQYSTKTSVLAALQPSSTAEGSHYGVERRPWTQRSQNSLLPSLNTRRNTTASWLSRAG
jgi:hypothetical protein